jgi:hypothetical protein
MGAARLLKPILGELGFVGGCTTGVLITDKAAADVNPTHDVDAMAEISSYAGCVLTLPCFGNEQAERYS